VQEVYNGGVGTIRVGFWRAKSNAKTHWKSICNRTLARFRKQRLFALCDGVLLRWRAFLSFVVQRQVQGERSVFLFWRDALRPRIHPLTKRPVPRSEARKRIHRYRWSYKIG